MELQQRTNPLLCRVGLHRWSTWGPGRCLQVIWMSAPVLEVATSRDDARDGAVAFAIGQDGVCLGCQLGRRRYCRSGIPGDASFIDQVPQLPGVPAKRYSFRWSLQRLAVAQMLGIVDADAAEWLPRRTMTRLPDATLPACQTWPKQKPLPALCRLVLHVGQDVCTGCHRIP
jgi:hypothetical protein